MQAEIRAKPYKASEIAWSHRDGAAGGAAEEGTWGNPQLDFLGHSITSSKSQTKSWGMGSWKPQPFVPPQGYMLHLAKEQQLHKQQREWLCYKRAKHLRPFWRTEVGEILGGSHKEAMTTLACHQVNKDKLQLERLQELDGNPRKQSKESDQQAASLPSSGTGGRARTMERQQVVGGGGEVLMGGSKKENHTYSKNSWWGRNTHVQVWLQFWLSAGAGPKCCYGTAQLLLLERTLPILTSPWMFPMPTLFAQKLAETIKFGRNSQI